MAPANPAPFMEKTKSESTLKDIYPVLIAMVSFAGYIVVFAYEAGFCNVYGIPLELISLSLTTVLPVACAVGIVLLYFSLALPSVLRTV
jgi:hypothetical protein